MEPIYKMKTKTVVLILALLFLASCKRLDLESTKVHPLINAFEYSDKCPLACWMGIHLGTTTAKEALTILEASSQIIPGSLKILDNELRGQWFSTRETTAESVFYIVLSKGFAESIVFSSLYAFTMANFTKLFGDPSEMTIWVEDSPDGPYLTYVVFYSSPKIAILGDPLGSFSGPSSGDQIQNLWINMDYETVEATVVDEGNHRQAWIGYGHLQEYLPGFVVPEISTQLPSP
jgi:hypothetical protein